MSYARFNDGDVYLIAAVNADWVCIACRLTEKTPTATSEGWYGDTELATLENVQTHMRAHLDAGQVVPDHCLQRIKEEMAELTGP